MRSHIENVNYLIHKGLLEELNVCLVGRHGRDMRVSGDKRAMLRLKFECEAAKLKLSSALKASFQIDALLPGLNIVGEITRREFEALNAVRFQDCIRRTHQVVADAGLTPDGIREVVLVGGSTRIPKVSIPAAAGKFLR